MNFVLHKSAQLWPQPFIHVNSCSRMCKITLKNTGAEAGSFCSHEKSTLIPVFKQKTLYPDASLHID